MHMPRAYIFLVICVYPSPSQIVNVHYTYLERGVFELVTDICTAKPALLVDNKIKLKYFEHLDNDKIR